MDQSRYMRLVTAIQGMEIHLKYKGKMRLTRLATPQNLRAIATEFTKKKYARSEKGMETALSDLKEFKEKLLDERAKFAALKEVLT
jgi:hypothetical protein